PHHLRGLSPSFRDLLLLLGEQRFRRSALALGRFDVAFDLLLALADHFEDRLPGGESQNDGHDDEGDDRPEDESWTDIHERRCQNKRAHWVPLNHRICNSGTRRHIAAATSAAATAVRF